MISAENAKDRLRNALDEIQHFRGVQAPKGDASQGDALPLLHQIDESEREFTDAMDDDFNTPRALAVIFNLTRDINVALRDADRTSDTALSNGLRLAGEALERFGSVLGGLLEGSEQGVSYIDMSVRIIDLRADQELVRKLIECGQPLPKDVVDRIVEYRIQRRDEKDWATADAIRSWLSGVGVIVDDTSKGARWRPKTSGT
jgi:cysteinyl-tRNA synthetase